MDCELICSWLRLSAGSWPPDHYTLLGLEPGEADPARIEQQVHQRMEKVRHYQLTHPEPATEAMNRLAQALVCLTDPLARQIYDALLFPGQISAISNPPPIRRRGSSSSTLGEVAGSPGLDSLPPGQTVLDWESSPPPSRRTGTDTETPAASAEDTQEIRVYSAVEGEEQAERGSRNSPEVPPARPFPGIETHSRSDAGYWTFSASRGPGLNTRRGLYYRAVCVRQLLWVWEQAGAFLNQPARMIQRPSEATQLIRRMTLIRELLDTVRTPLGEAGQPGYLVLSLARQKLIVPMFQTLLPSQREALARDWQAGHQLLLAQREHLLDAFRVQRTRSRWLTFLRTLLAAALSSPSLLLLLALTVVLDIVFPDLREFWLRQAISFAALLALKVLAWWVSLRPVRPQWTPPLAGAARSSPPRVAMRKQPTSSRA
jgi:hypothetical protein